MSNDEELEKRVARLERKFEEEQKQKVRNLRSAIVFLLTLLGAVLTWVAAQIGDSISIVWGKGN